MIIATALLTHDISLGTDGNQAVDVLADGHKNLSGHVAALLGARSLVLNVNTSGALFDEQLCELHDGSQTSVTGISVGDNGSEEISVGNLRPLFPGCGEALLALLPVVEELCHKEMLDLVRDSGLEQLACFC
jgi:hypothetical protein